MMQFSRALALAAAMIGIALLAVFEVVPTEVAQYAPLALMMFVPWALDERRCNRAQGR